MTSIGQDKASRVAGLDQSKATTGIDIAVLMASIRTSDAVPRVGQGDMSSAALQQLLELALARLGDAQDEIASLKAEVAELKDSRPKEPAIDQMKMARGLMKKQLRHLVKDLSRPTMDDPYSTQIRKEATAGLKSLQDVLPEGPAKTAINEGLEQARNLSQGNTERWTLGQTIEVADTLMSTAKQSGADRAQAVLSEHGFGLADQLNRSSMDDPYSLKLRTQTAIVLKTARDQLPDQNPVARALDRAISDGDQASTGRATRHAYGRALETIQAMLDG